MNISLTPQLEDLVKRKVESGLYTSASEVMREALRLLEQRDKIAEIKLQELKKEIQAGLNSGESVPLDMQEIINHGKERLKAKHSKE